VAGRVKVNGEVVSKTGIIIDETRDVVTVKDRPCEIPPAGIYVVLNKPAGYLTTLKDRFGRKTIVDLLKDVPRRIYPVGRLDYDSEGVLLLTDDGDLAFRLTHPSFGVKKLYTVGVKGVFPPDQLRRFQEGIRLQDGHLATASVRILGQQENFTILSIELTEGHKREIKQMCKAIGYPVFSIRRIRFAGVTTDGLARGKWRYLTPSEVTRLKNKVGLH
jgi:pseudouridine synthase